MRPYHPGSPLPIRTAKLSRVECQQYQRGGPVGKVTCCMFLLCFARSLFKMQVRGVCTVTACKALTYNTLTFYVHVDVRALNLNLNSLNLNESRSVLCEELVDCPLDVLIELVRERPEERRGSLRHLPRSEEVSRRTRAATATGAATLPDPRDHFCELLLVERLDSLADVSSERSECHLELPTPL